MFDFVIIDTEDGIQVIDRNCGMPYSALSPVQLMEYTEIDLQLAYMDRMERRASAGRKRRLVKGIIRKLACFCGLV